MKRPSYFISARSASADVLAADIVLAMNDQFPKVEGLGILGESTGRSRAMKLGDLQQCQTLGLHDKEQRTPEAEAYLEELKRQITESAPQIALLVGYSYLHHELAKFFKTLEMPVVLYEVTPQAATRNIPATEIRSVVNVALGISTQGSELVREAEIPYFFIGSPHKDRVTRVLVSPSSLGLTPDRTLVSLFPGGRHEDLPKIFPLFWRLAKRLATLPNTEVVMSLADLQGHESDLVVDGRAVLNLPEQDPERGGIRTLSGMNLELLSVSSLAITGVGAISIECGLMGLPFVPILPRKPAQTSPQVMLNQILGRSLVPEYHAEQSENELFEAASLLMTKGPVRDTMQRELETVARELQGYAAENAVEYIGREIALWKQATTKKAKGTKSA